jgi:hypothetical protein
VGGARGSQVEEGRLFRGMDASPGSDMAQTGLDKLVALRPLLTRPGQQRTRPGQQRTLVDVGPGYPAGQWSCGRTGSQELSLAQQGGQVIDPRIGEGEGVDVGRVFNGTDAGRQAER